MAAPVSSHIVTYLFSNSHSVCVDGAEEERLKGGRAGRWMVHEKDFWGCRFKGDEVVWGWRVEGVSGQGGEGGGGCMGMRLKR